jgi:NAD+ kinase
MKIALFPNELKDQRLMISKEICRFLKERGVDVFIEDPHVPSVDAHPLSELEPGQMDFRISLGGDGTILQLAHRYPHVTAPLLGINLGSLGFLADIPLNDIYPSLQNLLDGHFTIENRMMLKGHTSEGEMCFAVNEVVIHRAHNPCLIDLAIYVDGLYLNTFSADGIIISTPSGSTAYSLAAGGPIVSPELQAFIITPISPHTISNRPIVLKPTKDIQVTYLTPRQPVEVSYDGISNFTLETNATLTTAVSSNYFPLVKLAQHDYFSTLREKLGWHGKLKNTFSWLSKKFLSCLSDYPFGAQYFKKKFQQKQIGLKKSSGRFIVQGVCKGDKSFLFIGSWSTYWWEKRKSI